MFLRWKYADRMVLLMWVWNERVLSRTTPRLFTWGEGETEELSMERVRLGCFDNEDFEPMRSTSVLSLFNLRKLEVSQDLISCRQVQREVGGKVEDGLEER